MKENFDDIVRRRWEERNYPVDRNHREEMEKLLDREKRRKGLPFWWLSGLIIVAAIIALGLLESGDHKEAEAKAEAKAKAEEVTQSEDKAEAKVQAEDKTEAENEAQYAIDNTQLTNSQKEKRNRKKESKSLVKLNSENADSDAIIENSKGTPLEAGGVAEDEEQIPPGGYKVELENPGQVRIPSEIATIRVFPDSLEYDPWTNAIYRDGTVRSLNITKPVDALAIVEVDAAQRGLNEITPAHRMKHPLYLVGEGGGGLVLASKPSYTGGYKVNLGAGIGMRVASRVHLQLTGGYLMHERGFDFERSSAVNTPDFGARSVFNSLTPDRLHYAYGKLGVAYRFGRSSINAHVGTQYLYGAQGTISVVNHTQFSTADEVTTRYTWLKTTGLRKWQYWTDASYGYMILPKLYMQGGIGFYLTSFAEEDEPTNGYYWNGKSAKLQPFITLNYLLHGKL